MPWVILHETACDGWVPFEHTVDDKGNNVPVTYATEALAEEALAEFFDEVEHEITYGARAEDEGYDIEAFSIEELG